MIKIIQNISKLFKIDIFKYDQMISTLPFHTFSYFFWPDGPLVRIFCPYDAAKVFAKRCNILTMRFWALTKLFSIVAQRSELTTPQVCAARAFLAFFSMAAWVGMRSKISPQSVQLTLLSEPLLPCFVRWMCLHTRLRNGVLLGGGTSCSEFSSSVLTTLHSESEPVSDARCRIWERKSSTSVLDMKQMAARATIFAKKLKRTKTNPGQLATSALLALAALAMWSMWALLPSYFEPQFPTAPAIYQSDSISKILQDGLWEYVGLACLVNLSHISFFPIFS